MVERYQETLVPLCNDRRMKTRKDKAEENKEKNSNLKHKVDMINERNEKIIKKAEYDDNNGGNRVIILKKANNVRKERWKE